MGGEEEKSIPLRIGEQEGCLYDSDWDSSLEWYSPIPPCQFGGLWLPFENYSYWGKGYP